MRLNFKFVASHPTYSRTIYDFLAGALAAIACVAFSFWLFPEQLSYGVLAAPLVMLATNAMLGIYTRFKIADGKTKTLLISLSLGLVLVMMRLGSIPWALSVMWAVMVWSPLVMPRLFLNIHRQSGSSMLTTAVRSRGPVLVVGGAGYIGSHVVDQLLKSGAQVRVLDRLTYGRASLKDFEANPAFEFVEGDATDIVKLNTAMNNVSSVVHLAGLVGDPACAVDENFTRHTNVIATRMVKEVAKSLGIPRLVFASSCSVYGVSDEAVDETSALNPVSLYAKTKIDSENELLLSQDDNFTVTVLRFATVFGHSRRPRFDLVGNLFTAQAYVDGMINVAGPDQWRPFVHVRDLARAVVMVLKADVSTVRGEIFNVGDDRLNKTIGQLAETVKDIVGKERDVQTKLNTEFKDLRNYSVSFQKIKKRWDSVRKHCSKTASGRF